MKRYRVVIDGKAYKTDSAIYVLQLVRKAQKESKEFRIYDTMFNLEISEFEVKQDVKAERVTLKHKMHKFNARRGR